MLTTERRCPKCQKPASPHCETKACTWVNCGNCDRIVRPDGRGYPR